MKLLEQEFRARAKALREAAMGMRSRQAREELLRLAADYESRADALDRLNRPAGRRP